MQPSLLQLLRKAGHEAYDFRNPAPGNTGFAWSNIDPDWLAWSPEEFRVALTHPLSVEGFSLDMAALKWCEACVLLLPCGKSAHLELGYACGAGKITVAHCWRPEEPELMYRMLDAITTTETELLEFLVMAEQSKKGGAK